MSNLKKEKGSSSSEVDSYKVFNFNNIFLKDKRFKGVIKILIKEFIKKSKSEFKSVFDSGFRLKKTCEVFILFDF